VDILSNNFYRWQDGDLYIYLHIKTNAKRDRVVGVHGNKLKVDVAAIPERNKANQHLIKFLAGYFSVPINQVKLLRGLTKCDKLVRVVSPKNNTDLFSQSNSSLK
jgi:uncharacterized protein